MKRQLVFLCALLMAFAFAGQELSAGGIKGGLSIANVSFKESVFDGKSLLGFQAGVFFTFDVSEYISIQPEGYYAMKGSRLSDESDFKLTYIEVPVLIKVTLPVEGGLRPSLFAGGYGAFQLSAKYKSAGATTDVENLKKFDYGMVFGGCVELGMGGVKLLLDARYTVGLANIWDGGGVISYKNRTFVIMAGFAF